MKNTFIKTIGGAFLTILMLIACAQIQVSAQQDESIIEKQNIESQTSDALFRGYSRDLEGTWNATVTVRNCQTNAELTTFFALNTFMHGGTMQEFSTGAAPLPRGPGHGIWSHDTGRKFTYAFQFFRFNADGTYAGLTKARRLVDLNQFGSNYSATATIEVYNPAGTLVATACATETASRFE